MKMQQVESSNIAEIGYDKDSKTLRVKFKNGGLYDYSDVPESEYAAFLSAESHGKYLNQNIKNRYDYSKISS